jgi:hypothetical protein
MYLLAAVLVFTACAHNEERVSGWWSTRGVTWETGDNDLTGGDE